MAPPDVARQTFECAGVTITTGAVEVAARHVVELAADAPRGRHVHLCSSDTLVNAHRDAELRTVLGGSSANLPDGMAVVLAGRMICPGIEVERVAGTELMTAVWRQGQPTGLRHYLLGSTETVQRELCRRLRSAFPTAQIVGSESPPFRELSDAEFDEQVTRIRDSGAQVVWVGLGSPKQDRAVARLADRIPAVFVAVGAAFDFIAGTKRRAPRWMQRTGLEWLFRLATEPRRLWRRYLIGLPRFALVVRRDVRTSRR